MKIPKILKLIKKDKPIDMLAPVNIIVDVYSFKGELMYTAYLRDRYSLARDLKLQQYLKVNKMSTPSLDGSAPYILKQREPNDAELILYFK